MMISEHVYTLFALNWPFKTYFVFTVILEHRTAHYTDSVKRPRGSFPPLTTL